jgi:H+/Cl- antiporter ClcA
MEQPNVTHDGEARLTGRFWLALLLTSVATGLCGDGLMWLLKQTETIAFKYEGGSFQAAVALDSPWHRVFVLTLAGVVGSLSWWLIRRYLGHERSEIDDALWSGDGELGLRRSALTSIVSEIVIGMGASIGREAAPKLMGGAAGSRIAHYFALTPAQKKLLVACGGGAGLACVYNVPLGGAIFTAEILYGSFALPVAVTALVSSALATFTAWLTLPSWATYGDIAPFPFTGSLMVWSVIAGLLIGVVAVGFIRVIGWVSHYRASGNTILWAMPLTFMLVGVSGIWYPQLFGNGKGIAHDAFLGLGSGGFFLALAILKPLTTTVTVGSGAAGGLFTPFLATGAALGASLGIAWSHLWPASPVGAFALVGAAAMLAASMQAPLSGMVLVMELTHGGFNIMLPMLVATALATWTVRVLDGYSIYSARLPGRPHTTRSDHA